MGLCAGLSLRVSALTAAGWTQGAEETRALGPYVPPTLENCAGVVREVWLPWEAWARF